MKMKLWSFHRIRWTQQIGLLPMYGSSYLKGYSTAALIQRSWVQILLKSQNFFRIYLQFLKLQLPMWQSDLHLKKVILSVETVLFIRVVYFFIDAHLNIYNLRVTGHLPLKWIHLQSHISSKRQQGLKKEHKSQVP